MALVMPVATGEAVFCDPCDAWVLKSEVTWEAEKVYLEGWYELPILVAPSGTDTIQNSICQNCGDEDSITAERYRENEQTLFQCTNCTALFYDMNDARRCCG